jgi:hypothetical protein
LREEHVVPLHIESEDENEEGFGGDFRPRARNGNQQGESYKMRADLPFFSGVVDIEQFLDWIYEVERFFDIIRIEAERKMDFVAYKLRGSAGARWQCHQDLLRTRGQPLIRNWTQIKTLLKGRFLALDYEQVLFQRFHNCYQSTHSVSAYTKEFLCLQARCNLNENEEQQVARYVNGLNYSVQDYLSMQGI